MQFSKIIIPSLAAMAMAAPSDLVRRENQEVTEAIIFAVQADDCDLLKCAAVIASAACIGASIALGPAGIPGALGCTAGGASAVSTALRSKVSQLICYRSAPVPIAWMRLATS